MTAHAHPGRRRRRGIRNTLEQHLRTHGFDVIAARGRDRGRSSGSRAPRPDLVLSDLAMPHADGFELIQQIRAGGATPILVLSVRGGDVDKVRALDLGADDYVDEAVLDARAARPRSCAAAPRRHDATNDRFEFPACRSTSRSARSSRAPARSS